MGLATLIGSSAPDKGRGGRDEAKAVPGRRRSHFLTRLMVTVMAVLLPMLCLHAYTLYSDFRRAHAAAYGAVLNDSQAAAQRVGDLIDRSERLLRLIASREDILALDTARCERFLGGFGSVNPIYANVTVADRRGRIVCVSVGARPASSPALAEREWFPRTLASNDFVLSKPILRGVVVQRPLMLLAIALRDPQGQAIGTLAVSLDLAELSRLLALHAQPPDGAITLIDRDGDILARNVDPLSWIGHRLSPSAQALRSESPEGVIVVRGVDGIERAFASADVGKYGLRVSAGIPVQSIFAAPRTAALQSATVALLTLLFAVSLAGLLARSLSRPIASLSAAVRAWATGDQAVRADERLPGEFGELAQEFNRMIEARQASEDRLRQTEMRYADLLDSVDMIVVTVDTAGRVTACNDALLRLTGWRRDEVIGVDWFTQFLPDDSGLRERLRRAQAQDRLPRVNENEIVTRSGRRRLVRWNNSVLRAEDGTALGVRGIGEDITERHEAELARQASEAAASANRAKTEFISRMSHELRTPLNAVLGFSQLLRHSAGAKVDAGERQQLEMIIMAGEQLRALIDDLLDIACIEAGRIKVTPQPLELCALLDGALQLCAPQAEAHDVTLTRAYAGRATRHVCSDATRLTQVVLNLVSNAIKYNRPGGAVTVDIRPVADEAAHAVEIVVADTGIGMTPQQLQGLFQPFNRLGREHEGIPGTGIGLMLSRQLVELLGGTLEFRSEAQHGTVATVRLPATPGLEAMPSRETVAAPSPAAAPVSSPREPSGSVLYIEDNPVNAMLVIQLLARWPSVRVEVSTDGQTGLRRARELKPDLLLLDMQLPDMPGLEVMQRLRADPATCTLTVVALSASAMPEEVEAARHAGAIAYWTKPIDFERFLLDLSAHLPSVERPDEESPVV
ncbi:ATP-binding protein [Aquabacterium sp. J223]|uniref:ATP-binding protein n=1 Tax=Aquabacterium sp. J223 TaxID=2898431 RepID=UPI0021AD7045|nr:ATP-binding protein [Aquabacterium sp. J223]UUX95038.1 ATP-binding protein [Aquabacterium sp. J223]